MCLQQHCSMLFVAHLEIQFLHPLGVDSFCCIGGSKYQFCGYFKKCNLVTCT
jgi:hypothetical protein